MNSSSHWDTIKGLGATGVFVFAQVTANMQAVEWGLRMLSLLVGIAVGVATIRSIWRTPGKK